MVYTQKSLKQEIEIDNFWTVMTKSPKSVSEAYGILIPVQMLMNMINMYIFYTWQRNDYLAREIFAQKPSHAHRMRIVQLGLATNKPTPVLINGIERSRAERSFVKLAAKNLLSLVNRQLRPDILISPEIGSYEQTKVRRLTFTFR